MRKTKYIQKKKNFLVLGGLRKKYLAGCQILSPKLYLYVLKKVFFNIVKDLFKSFAILRSSGKIQIGSTEQENFLLGGLRRKYLARCLILRSKHYLYTVKQKSVFQYSEGLIQIN